MTEHTTVATTPTTSRTAPTGTDRTPRRAGVIEWLDAWTLRAFNPPLVTTYRLVPMSRPAPER